MLPAEIHALLMSVDFPVPEGVRLAAGTRTARLLGRIMALFDSPPVAIALRNTVYIPDIERYQRLSPEARAALLAHEFEHVRQWRRWGGLRFLGHYLREYLRVRRQGIDTHDLAEGIDLEREALAVERHILAVLNDRRRAV